MGADERVGAVAAAAAAVELVRLGRFFDRLPQPVLWLLVSFLSSFLFSPQQTQGLIVDYQAKKKKKKKESKKEKSTRVRACVRAFYVPVMD